jgi:hypothetical protein
MYSIIPADRPATFRRRCEGGILPLRAHAFRYARARFLAFSPSLTPYPFYRSFSLASFEFNRVYGETFIS